MFLTLSTMIATSCRRPELFFPSRVKDDRAKTFENRLHFFTTFPNGFLPLGIEVETFEDKPFHLVGNQLHPNNYGVLPAFVLPSIYNLYDPYRFNKPKAKGKDIDLNYAMEILFKELRNVLDKGELIIFASHYFNSPSLNELLISLENKYKNIIFYQFPSYDFYLNQQLANKILYCSSSYFLKDVTKSDLILNFRRDFLQNDVFMPYYTYQFRSKEAILVTFENIFTLTGANSSYRYIIERDNFENALLILLKYVSNIQGNNEILNLFNNFYSFNDFLPTTLFELLQSSKGKKISILVDDALPPTCHILSNLIEYAWNQAPPNYLFKIDIPLYSDELTSLREVLKEQEIGKIVFLESNPYFLGVNELENILETLTNSKIVTLSMYYDEIARRSELYIPTKHYLEFWQDYRNVDGSVSSQQPIIFPLNNYSISIGEFLLAFRNFLSDGIIGIPDYFVYLKELYTKRIEQSGLTDLIRQGFFADNVTQSVEIRSMNIDYANAYSYLKKNISRDRNNELTVELLPNSKFFDPTYSNNIYLKELPDSITGIAWDNLLYMGKNIAEKFNLRTGDFVQISNKLNDAKSELPVYVSDFFAPSTIYGYLGFGNFYENEVFQLSNANLSKLIAFGHKGNEGIFPNNCIIPIQLTKIDTKKELTFVVSQSNVYKKSTLEWVLQKYQNELIVSLYQTSKLLGKNWNMLINLDSCIGCNMCLLACQLENNIPVVGREEVQKEREMYWIKVHKYEFDGAKHLLFIPIMCQQCDNAPCESVCPVGATLHSSDGLNEMIYNRCIGSRFCMANCPYKVRKFNFDSPDNVHPNYLQQLTNPIVTVRSRGVAEKCTFCIHRIREGKQEAILAGKNEDEFTIATACQEVCPTQAICFGRRNRIEKEQLSDQIYQLLTQFNTKPNVYFQVNFNNDK